LTWLVSQQHFIIANHLPEIVAAVAFMTGSLRGAIALAVFRIWAGWAMTRYRDDPVIWSWSRTDA
jgi:hypothetical protein